jgi:hypothetical protein
MLSGIEEESPVVAGCLPFGQHLSTLQRLVSHGCSVSGGQEMAFGDAKKEHRLYSLSLPLTLDFAKSFCYSGSITPPLLSVTCAEVP